MKKIILASVFLILTFVLAGCRQSTTTNGSQTTGVLTTTAEPTILDAVNALANPYNVALFMNADPIHFVNVNFVLSDPEGGIVEWHSEGLPENVESVAAALKTTSVGKRTVHGYAATMGPLDPGNVYFYRVGNAAGTVFDAWRRYQAPSESPASVSFAVFADPQENDQLGYMAFAHAYLSVMAYAAKDIDFGMFVGDFINDHDDRSQWNWFFKYSAAFSFTKPIAATIGNHEHGAISDDRMTNMEYDAYTHLPTNGPTYETFDELPDDKRHSRIDDGKTYSFDYGAAHFVAIDSELFCDASSACENYDASNAQILLDWLAADLAATTATWKIVYLHRGPYSLSYDSGRVRELLIPILDAYGVDLVLSGHDHQYSRAVYLVGAPITFARTDVYARGTFSLIDAGSGVLNFNAYPDTAGVTYLVGNTAGTKFYSESKNSGIVVQYAYGDDNPVIPIVEVTAEAITVTSYVILKNGTVDIVPQSVEILERFVILK